MSDLYIPDLGEDCDVLTAAMKYAAAGWYMLPIRRNARKHPGSVVGADWQHKSARDVEQIIAWFAGTDHGVALHLGRSSAVAFDVDYPDQVPGVLGEAVEVSDPPFQTTRIGGDVRRGHYVFAQPEGRMLGNGTGKLGGAWGEVRGKNGIIVVAPSPHDEEADGGMYQWHDVGPLPILPESVAELLGDAGAEADAATDAEIVEFLESCTGSQRPELAAGWVTTFNRKVAEGESRHVRMISVCAGAMKEARAGYFDARKAAEQLQAAFVAAVGEQPKPGSQQREPRKGGIAASEWHGILAWAVAQAKVADLEEVRARVAEQMPNGEEWVGDLPSNVDPDTGEIIMSLDECHAVFRRWLGTEYDLDVLDVMLCALAVERLDGDPLWMLVISGPGAAKTETVQASAGAGALVESTITGEAALLSGTPKHERSKKATGGLLRKLGDSGVLVVKDVTSIISMSRDRRAEVLAALREVYDGRWSRSVGSEGGLTLTWVGRIAVIGAVTTAWDSAHSVVSAMGDRFVSVRLDSGAGSGRQAAFRRTMANTGDEVAMRAEMAAAVGGVIAGIDHTADLALTEAETERLLPAADLVTLARTGVEFDYKGDVVDAHAPEMPTRFARQLQQIMRGGLALGMDRDRCQRLAIRAARDSMPPVRLAIVDDLADNPHSTPPDIRRRIGLPWRTVDRQCQALHMLGVVTVDEVEFGATGKSRWYYSLADGIDPTSLKSTPDLATPPPCPPRREEGKKASEGSPRPPPPILA